MTFYNNSKSLKVQKCLCPSAGILEDAKMRFPLQRGSFERSYIVFTIELPVRLFCPILFDSYVGPFVYLSSPLSQQEYFQNTIQLPNSTMSWVMIAANCHSGDRTDSQFKKQSGFILAIRQFCPFKGLLSEPNLTISFGETTNNGPWY